MGKSPLTLIVGKTLANTPREVVLNNMIQTRLGRLVSPMISGLEEFLFICNMI